MKCRSNPIPYVYPYPLFSSVILPLGTELQGVVVEIFSLNWDPQIKKEHDFINILLAPLCSRPCQSAVTAEEG